MKILIILLLLFSSVFSYETTLSYRSEYESVGDLIYDVNLTSGGTNNYKIISGNNDGHYTIDNNGLLTIAKEIIDNDSVTTNQLIITCGNDTIGVTVVDGYDYFTTNKTDYTVLDDDLGAHIIDDNNWTVYNNDWGKGDAVLGKDFKMAIMYKNSAPDSTIFIWDVPSQASNFNGSSVWCYISLLWGNRVSMREDLPDFPFQISKLKSLLFDFDFEKLYGSEDYKIAMNMFLTDEDSIAPFRDNDGDFFMVFDQVGTWVPPYPISLGDTTMFGESFELLYKSDESGYEYRRVIVKDNGKVLSGNLDLKRLFDRFIAEGYIDPLQYIPNIQIGIEVTGGYGAIRVNNAQFYKDKLSSVKIKSFVFNNFYPNPVSDQLTVIGAHKVEILSPIGEPLIVVEKSRTIQKIDVSNLTKGIYYIRTNFGTDSFYKR